MGDRLKADPRRRGGAGYGFGKSILSRMKSLAVSKPTSAALARTAASSLAAGPKCDAEAHLVFFGNWWADWFWAAVVACYLYCSINF